ncbi:hypothetical protein [Raineyella sp.]|uniref:Uncharacterized protein n=1 Tax=bioreactor metagenome TaxID=1076179 RepID=A0A644X2Z4_9ZZZZ|nr:hypothetical protein [Raineyella sp.]MEA5153603.1 hypothetical protein [Raineyella sp.]
MSLLIREGKSGWPEPVGRYDNEAGRQAVLVAVTDGNGKLSLVVLMGKYAYADPSRR